MSWMPIMGTKVQNTAAWMAGCRASLPKISLDIFAKLWLNPAALKKHSEYVTDVSPLEDVCLSLRNRFFLEHVEKFLLEDKGIFINLGAGFSSLSYLLPDGHNYIEIDHPNNIRRKKKLVSQLVVKGLLPKRSIDFISVDLNNLGEINTLQEALQKKVKQKRCFLLMEGLLYYLSQTSADALFKLANKILSPGSQFGLVTWNPETFKYPVYKRFEQFLQEKGQSLPKFICHNPSQIASLAHYQLVKQVDYKMLSAEYTNSPLKDSDDAFWEIMTILERETNEYTLPNPASSDLR